MYRLQDYNDFFHINVKDAEGGKFLNLLFIYYICVYLSFSDRSIKQTKNDRDLKFGTHTHTPLDHIYKWFLLFLSKKSTLGAAATSIEKLLCHMHFLHLFVSLIALLIVTLKVRSGRGQDSKLTDF